eukprot:g11369.t1
MDSVPKDIFQARVGRLLELWPFDADQLVLVAGMQRKDVTEEDHLGVGAWPQTILMHQWLFNLEFPELVLVIRRSGNMIIWSKEKKLRYFHEVKTDKMEFMCREHPNNEQMDERQLEEFICKVKDGELSVALLDEQPLGPFGQATMKRLRSEDAGLQVRDAHSGILQLLEKKDAIEIEHLRRGATFGCVVMQEHLMKKWQDVVDEETRITHAGFCADIEEGRCSWKLVELSSVALFFTLGFSVAKADLTFKVFTRDPQGYASHIRLVDGSQIEYFSDEFNELCTQVGATPVSANNPIGAGCDVAGGSCVQGISQRFQHPQVREVDAAARAELPEHQYLEDGQLDNPYSGRVSAGNYTEVITTKEFIPDGDLLPVPHTRTQLCHYALRLTQSVSAQNSAAWSRFKQLVAYGFELLRRRKRQRSTRLGCSRGEAYALTGNHISVHVPPRKGEPNSADHRLSSIAYTDDIPPLQEGTHVVRIVYDVSSIRWDEYGTDFDSDATGDFLRLQHSGRAGLLSVELDGRRVIVVPVETWS